MKPARYKRETHEIEALQYTGENLDQVREYVGKGLVHVERKETETIEGTPGCREEREVVVLGFDHPLHHQRNIYPGWWFAKKGPHLILAMSDRRFQEEYTPVEVAES